MELFSKSQRFNKIKGNNDCMVLKKMLITDKPVYGSELKSTEYEV